MKQNKNIIDGSLLWTRYLIQHWSHKNECQPVRRLREIRGLCHRVWTLQSAKPLPPPQAVTWQSGCMLLTSWPCSSQAFSFLYPPQHWVQHLQGVFLVIMEGFSILSCLCSFVCILCRAPQRRKRSLLISVYYVLCHLTCDHFNLTI